MYLQSIWFTVATPEDKDLLRHDVCRENFSVMLQFMFGSDLLYYEILIQKLYEGEPGADSDQAANNATYAALHEPLQWATRKALQAGLSLREKSLDKNSSLSWSSYKRTKPLNIIGE